jgi:hypothetical protein
MTKNRWQLIGSYVRTINKSSYIEVEGTQYPLHANLSKLPLANSPKDRSARLEPFPEVPEF